MKFKHVSRHVVAASVASLALSVCAGTAGWWRFEGGTPGVTVPAELVNSVSGGSVPSLTAISMDGTSMGQVEANMPKYIDGFSAGVNIYDPVEGRSLGNGSSLRMRESYASNAAQSGGAYLEAASLPCNGSFTMECFFRVTETDSSVVTGLQMAPILTFQSSGYGDTSIQLYNGKYYGRITPKGSDGNSKSAQAVTGASAILDGKWHHAAMSYDATAKKATWYFDYVEVGSKTLKSDEVGIYIPSGTKFLVGANGQVSGRNFPGEVDEVRFSDAVLDPSEFLRFSDPSDSDDVAMHITFDGVPSWWGGDTEAFETRSSRFSTPYFASTTGSTAKPVESNDVPSSTIYYSYYSESGRANALSVDMNRTSSNVGSVLKVDYRDANGWPAPAMSLEEEFTIEFFARFKSQTHENYTPILSDGGYRFRWGYADADTGKKLILQVESTNATTQTRGNLNVFAETDTSIADGNWHHFALVYQRSSRQVVGYIDYGSYAKMSVTLSEGYVFSGQYTSLVFGGVSESSRLCDIMFDEIRITSKALGVKDFMTKQTQESTMRLWLHFNGDYSADPGKPYQPDAVPVTVEGQAPGFSSDVYAGEFGVSTDERHALYRNNAHSLYLKGRSYVKANASLSQSLRNVTCESFVKINSLMPGEDDTKYAFLLSCAGTSINYPDFSLRVAAKADGGWDSQVVWCNAAGTGRDTMQVSLPTDGKWHHYAITMQETEDGGVTNTTVRFYCDYEENNTKTVNYVRWMNNEPVGTMLSIGQTWGTSHDYLVDEVRITEGVLSPELFLRRHIPDGFIIVVR